MSEQHDGAAERRQDGGNDPETVPEQRPPRSRGGTAALLFSLLTMAAVAAAGWFGYQQWRATQQALQRMEQAIGQAEAGRSGLEQRLGELQQAYAASRQNLEQQRLLMGRQQEALARQRRELAAEQQRLGDDYAAVQRALGRIDRRIGRSDTRWMAAEAAYLVALADERLRLQRDLPTALLALQAAAAKLENSGDNTWPGARRELQRIIAGLQAVQVPDRAARSGQLADLQRQVPELPLNLGPRAPDASAGTAPPPAEERRSWHGLLQAAWRRLQSVLVIRHQPRPLQLALPPARRQSLYLELKLRLDDARMALLRGDRTLYRAALESAGNLLQMFFATDDPAVSAMLKRLQELAEQPVTAAPPPEIAAALGPLQQRLRGDAGEDAGQ